MKFKAIFLLTCCLLTELCLGEERQGVVSIRINLNTPKTTQSAKIWIPYPLSSQHQTIENIRITGNFNDSAVYKEPKSGVLYLFAGWVKDSQQKILDMDFRVTARERKIKNLVDTGESVPAEIKKYLLPDWWVPTDGPVSDIAKRLETGKSGILAKAHAVYDWVVENTHRDPNVRGCGVGIVEVTLSKRSGKCADLSSVFVALARNIGVPAREVFGLRLGKKADQDITGDYHCWAEFYLPGTGWIPVDPSDVRKKMLADNLKLDQVKTLRDYFFGAVDPYRIVLERGGRGITLSPAPESSPVNYLMYPYAEVNGKALDFFDPVNFHYSVHFKQI